jgi:hypothetical protein
MLEQHIFLEAAPDLTPSTMQCHQDMLTEKLQLTNFNSQTISTNLLTIGNLHTLPFSELIYLWWRMPLLFLSSINLTGVTLSAGVVSVGSGSYIYKLSVGSNLIQRPNFVNGGNNAQSDCLQ